MNNYERSRLGAIAKNANQYKRTLDAYLSNPTICKNCHNPILPTDKLTVCKTKNKKFCNNKCSAEYNNTINPRIKVIHRCSCGNVVSRRGNTCRNCMYVNKRKARDCTKEELISRRKNYPSWRTSVSRHAISVYKDSGKLHICSVCGYSRYVEICHIIPVADFSGDASLSIINNIDNLVALCPNHHWEFDNGIIEI